MKTVITLFAFFFTAELFTAQNFEWARKLGGIGQDIGYSVVTDAAGNVYETGYFMGVVDMDPGPGENIVTTKGGADIYIRKLDAAGNFVWAVQFGSKGIDMGYAIAVDPSGNVYTTGFFRDTIDFDPGNGEYFLEATLRSFLGEPDPATQYNTTEDVFISKLSPAGDFIWARRIGGSGDDYGIGIAADGQGNVYTTGRVSDFRSATTDTVDLDPGPGVYNVSPAGGFILKLDASGNFTWGKQFGIVWAYSTQTQTNYPYVISKSYSAVFKSLAIDNSGNVITTGNIYSYLTDFDPGPGVFNLIAGSSSAVFISKLDTDGNFVWAKQIGGDYTSATYGQGISADASGNVCATGYFYGKVDFNPGTNTFNLSSAGGSNDIYVLKLNASGVFTWAKKIGANTEDRGLSVAFDAVGNVYTTGWYTGKVDFDPGTGKYTLSAAGNNIFISKLTSSGSFAWARNIGGPGEDSGNDIAVDENSNVCTTGYFSGTADFDPNTGVYNMTSAGNKDAFVVKLNQSSGPPAFAAVETRMPMAEFGLFPNPASHTISLNANGFSGQFNLRVINMMGQTVISQEVTLYGEDAYSFDISGLPSGMYKVLMMNNVERGEGTFVKE